MYSIHRFDYNTIIERGFLQYCKSPVSSLLFNENYYWFVFGTSALAYFKHKNTLISVGGLLAKEIDKRILLKNFIKFCREEKYEYVFLHFPLEDGILLNKEDMLVNQLGSSFVINNKDYKMEGKRFQQIRNKINKTKKKNVTVSMIETQSEFLKVKNQLNNINSEWIISKKSKLLKNLVTDFDLIDLDTGLHKLFVANIEKDIVAYIIYSRNFGFYNGWFHNLSRNSMDAPNGVMQLINKTAMEVLDDFNYLSFGFTPLVDINNKISTKKSIILNSILKYLESKGGVVYPAKSQRQYKMSWRPQIIEFEYIGFKKGKALSSIYTILKSTSSI